MRRNQVLENFKKTHREKFDFIVIGGGASGLGVAVDAATRGYKTILFEQSDFSKGTSSRSTKLVHGGVRYLAQGDISLVLEALRERGLLRQNAPHLVRNQAFIIPNFAWWDGPFYAVGMKVYDMMSGKLGLGPSQKLTKEETLKAIPNLSKEELNGGVIYYDGQFDDARMAINLAQTAHENGATVLNYMKVTGLLKDETGLVCGVKVEDQLGEGNYEVRAEVVVNATGVFSDDILTMDDPDAPHQIAPSQGIHLVLDKSFLQGDSAIMIPHTSDGRVLFAVPWHNAVIVGTTDTPMKKAELEPRPLEEEIEFILSTASRYLQKDPTRQDVLSVFAGLRPLAAPQKEGEETKEISRSHKVIISTSGLVSIIGGKWTTYRKMAEDTVDKAILVGGLPETKCQTENMALHGYVKNVNFEDPLYFYGSDRVNLADLISQNPSWREKIMVDTPYIKAQVIFSIRYEMAVTIEDFLARRVRALLLDARKSIEMAPEVAFLMAKELGYDQKWVDNQVEEYRKLAEGYILS
jgi:glycerol-3-phosphate dehydrogenase